MTYKEKTIKAVEILIARYKFISANGSFEKGKLDEEAFELLCKDHECYDDFFDKDKYRPEKSCPLCSIYPDISCAGCLNADEDGFGCSMILDTYRDEKIMKDRIKFLEKFLKYVDEIPAKYFTPSNWSYKRFQEFYKKYNMVDNINGD